MKEPSIRLITEHKKDFLSLLLLGDEQESSIDTYLERGHLFVLYDGDVKSLCVVTDEGNGTLEIQNLATDERDQCKGYATRLMAHIEEYYHGRYDRIILGTGDVPGILAFYERRGFTITHRLPDYFTVHYRHPIIEDGIVLKDKVYLEKTLPPKKTMILETNRLILRPLTITDAEAAYSGWTGDAEVAQYVSWLPHHSIDDTIEWLKEIEWKQDSRGTIMPKDNYIWGFVLKETGALFGSGGLIWAEDCRLFQVGYNIKKTHWNNGYTTEAMRAVLNFAATTLGIQRVAGGHAKENRASARVLEKLGFVYDRDDVTPHVDGIRYFDSREYILDLENH